MSRNVKDIRVKSISSKVANDFVRRHHYSGKNVNSQVHFGCFLHGQLHGVMSFGPPMKKLYMQKYVQKDGKDVHWNGIIELNRMAFNDYLPRNSESRCLSVAIRMIKKQAPHIKAIISFADATQCGDGTIYRASGFTLTDIKKNSSLQIDSDNVVYSTMSMTGKYIRRDFYEKFKHKGVSITNSWQRNRDLAGTKPIEGYQLRYMILLDKSYTLNVPNIPFSKIDGIGAGMYKGERITLAERRDNNAVEAQEKCV